AEDGIRDPLVTGVQTCALPIFGAIDVGEDGAEPADSRRRGTAGHEEERLRDVAVQSGEEALRAEGSEEQGKERMDVAETDRRIRSEERRVGKEGRYGG